MGTAHDQSRLRPRLGLESGGLRERRLLASTAFRERALRGPRGPQVPPNPARAGCLLAGCFSGCQGKSQYSLNTLINIMLSTLFLSRRYAAPQRKSRKPKSRKIHDTSRKNALRAPVRHLRQDRQRPRPVWGRVWRARAEPACHAPQVRRLLQDLGAGHLPQRRQDQPRPRIVSRRHPRHGPREGARQRARHRRGPRPPAAHAQGAHLREGQSRPWSRSTPGTGRAGAPKASGAPACATTSCRVSRASASMPSPPPTSWRCCSPSGSTKRVTAGRVRQRIGAVMKWGGRARIPRRQPGRRRALRGAPEDCGAQAAHAGAAPTRRSRRRLSA